MYVLSVVFPQRETSLYDGVHFTVSLLCTLQHTASLMLLLLCFFFFVQLLLLFINYIFYTYICMCSFIYTFVRYSFYTHTYTITYKRIPVTSSLRQCSLLFSTSHTSSFLLLAVYLVFFLPTLLLYTHHFYLFVFYFCYFNP